MLIAKEDFQLIKRIVGFYKPYVKRIVLVFSCIIAATAVNMILPVIGKQIIDRGLMQQDFPYTLYLAIVSMLLVLFEQGAGIIETKFWAYVNSMVLFTMNKAAVKQLLKVKIQFFNNTNFAEIMNNISMDVRNINRISEKSTFFIITLVFRVVGGMAGLILIDWRMAILIVLIIPLRYYLMKYLAKLRREMFEKYMQIYKDYSAWFGDVIGGIREIRLWGVETAVTGQFIKKQREIIKLDIKMNLIDKVNDFADSTLYHLVSNALYVVGIYIMINSELTVGGLLAFITYSAYVVGPISAILNIGYGFSSIAPSARRYFDFIDMEKEEDNPSYIITESVDKHPRGNISFENVSFAYENGREVLKDVNLKIKAGEKVAVIGPNGSGKSTMISLLQRMYSPSGGRILFDGKDIKDIRLRDYRKQISFVSHDTYIFNTTIKENIKFFTAARDADIQKASGLSSAHGFIEQLADKYESRVGRNGAKLSGGQRQKIALARAFLKQSEVLVLDEATSNCDVDSEAQINSIIGSCNKTAVIVTHKLAVLKAVDRIFMVTNGSVREIGTYKELQDEIDIYRDMVV